MCLLSNIVVSQVFVSVLFPGLWPRPGRSCGLQELWLPSLDSLNIRLRPQQCSGGSHFHLHFVVNLHLAFDCLSPFVFGRSDWLHCIKPHCQSSPVAWRHCGVQKLSDCFQESPGGELWELAWGHLIRCGALEKAASLLLPPDSPRLYL